MVNHALPTRQSLRRGYFFWLLGALATFAFIVWSMILLWSVPYYGLDPFDDAIRSTRGGTVTKVEPSGPAGLAGIKPGDRLSIVAGYATLYTPQPASKENTGAVTVAVQSANRQYQVELTPVAPPLHVEIKRLEPLVVAFIFFAVGLAIWVLRPFHRVPSIFFLASLLSADMLTTGALSAVYYPQSDLAFRLLLTLLAPVSLHFFSTFPTVLAARWRRPTLLIVYVVAALLVIATLLLPSSPSGVVEEVAGALSRIRRIYVALSLLAALAIFLRRQTQVPIQVRYRRSLVSAGTLFSLLPLMLLSFIPELVAGTALVDYSWTFLFLVLLPVSYAYAVHREELSRINLILNRSLVYVLLTMLLAGVYLLLSQALDYLVPSNWDQFLISGGLAILALLLYNPVRAFLQHWIDQIFYGGWYDYHSIVRAASAEISHASDLPQLLDKLMSIAHTMRFEEAALFWPDGDVLVPRGSFGHEKDQLDKWRLPLASSMAQCLTGTQRPLWHDQVRSSLTRAQSQLQEDEQTLLAADGLQYWLPLVSRGNLRGVLVLGRRQGETILGEEDIDILVPLAAQAAVAAENVALLEALRTRLTEMEDIRKTLVRTRRKLAQNEEVGHLRLAQELHDGAVQQLLGISYQLVSSRASHRTCAEFETIAGNGKRANGNSTRRTKDAKGATVRNGAHVGGTASLLVETNPELPLYQDPDAIRQEILSVVTQLRGLVGELRPAGLEEFGLTIALQGYVSRLQREASSDASAPIIHINLPEREVDLSGSVALCLFRVAQESLRNGMRHAQAQYITLQLSVLTDEAVLSVYDDGAGFNVPSHLSKLAQDNHFGLVGMAERVEWVGGRLMIESEPGVGTEITVRVPLSVVEE